MPLISSYRVDGTTLHLVEELHWTFEPNRKDAVQEWELQGFDEKSISLEQLRSIVSDSREVDIEVLEEKGQTKLILYDYWEGIESSVKCDKIIRHQRPHDLSEVTRYVVSLLERAGDTDKDLQRHRSMIKQIESFVAEEKSRKGRILEEKVEDGSRASVKAAGQLQILSPLENMIASFWATEK